MAEALIEERHLLKSLRWWDGFVIALCNPGFLVASLGFSMGALGTWGAVLLWAVSAGVGMLQTWIYAETASMFPDKPGGISLYAHEGWRGRFSLVGPIGAFGDRKSTRLNSSHMSISYAVFCLKKKKKKKTHPLKHM